MKKLLITFLIFGAVFAQPSRSTQSALKSLKDAIAYRQDFINRKQNRELMAQWYDDYTMYKYPWGLRQKTIERDQIEINIRVLQFYEKYDMGLANDENDGLISSKQRAKFNVEVMPLKFYEVLSKSKDIVFPEPKEACRH